MIRNSGLRGGSNLKGSEDVQPMQYVANLTDVMLVLACGLMAAVITFWRVNLNSVSAEVDRNTLERIDSSDVIYEEGDLSTGGLTSKGMVYEDPETGDLYIVETN